MVEDFLINHKSLQKPLTDKIGYKGGKDPLQDICKVLPNFAEKIHQCGIDSALFDCECRGKPQTSIS